LGLYPKTEIHNPRLNEYPEPLQVTSWPARDKLGSSSLIQYIFFRKKIIIFNATTQCC
jgi:hypothetical protein